MDIKTYKKLIAETNKLGMDLECEKFIIIRTSLRRALSEALILHSKSLGLVEVVKTIREQAGCVMATRVYKEYTGDDLRTSLAFVRDCL